MAYHCFFSDGGNLLQAGIFFDLYAPALVFCKVPVKAVEFILYHHINELLDVGHREEVTAYVKHESAVGKAGLVLIFTEGTSTAVPSPRISCSSVCRP